MFQQYQSQYQPQSQWQHPQYNQQTQQLNPNSIYLQQFQSPVNPTFPIPANMTHAAGYVGWALARNVIDNANITEQRALTFQVIANNNFNNEEFMAAYFVCVMHISIAATNNNVADPRPLVDRILPEIAKGLTATIWHKYTNGRAPSDSQTAYMQQQYAGFYQELLQEIQQHARMQQNQVQQYQPIQYQVNNGYQPSVLNSGYNSYNQQPVQPALNMRQAAQGLTANRPNPSAMNALTSWRSNNQGVNTYQSPQNGLNYQNRSGAMVQGNQALTNAPTSRLSDTGAGAMLARLKQQYNQQNQQPVEQSQPSQYQQYYSPNSAPAQQPIPNPQPAFPRNNERVNPVTQSTVNDISKDLDDAWQELLNNGNSERLSDEETAAYFDSTHFGMKLPPRGVEDSLDLTSGKEDTNNYTNLDTTTTQTVEQIKEERIHWSKWEPSKSQKFFYAWEPHRCYCYLVRNESGDLIQKFEMRKNVMNQNEHELRSAFVNEPVSGNTPSVQDVKEAETLRKNLTRNEKQLKKEEDKAINDGDDSALKTIPDVMASEYSANTPEDMFLLLDASQSEDDGKRVATGALGYHRTVFIGEDWDEEIKEASELECFADVVTKLRSWSEDKPALVSHLLPLYQRLCNDILYLKLQTKVGTTDLLGDWGSIKDYLKGEDLVEEFERESRKLLPSLITLMDDEDTKALVSTDLPKVGPHQHVNVIYTPISIFSIERSATSLGLPLDIGFQNGIVIADTLMSPLLCNLCKFITKTGVNNNALYFYMRTSDNELFSITQSNFGVDVFLVRNVTRSFNLNG